MKILRIQKGLYEVGAAIHERRGGALECRLLEQLGSLEASFEASGRRLMVYMETLAMLGPVSFSSDQLHLVDAPNKIYELIAGRLRLLFFYGSPGRLVICSHLFVKKSQKTPKAEVEEAVRIKRQFASDTANNAIQWMEEL